MLMILNKQYCGKIQLRNQDINILSLMLQTVYLSQSLLTNDNIEQLSIWASTACLSFLQHSDLSFDQRILLARLRTHCFDIKLIDRILLSDIDPESLLVVSSREEAIGKQHLNNIYVVSESDDFISSDRICSVRSITEARHLWAIPKQHKNLLAEFERSLRSNIGKLKKEDCEKWIKEIAVKYYDESNRELVVVRIAGVKLFSRLFAIKLKRNQNLKSIVFQNWRIHSLESSIQRQDQQIIQKTLLDEHRFKLKARVFFSWKSLI